MSLGATYLGAMVTGSGILYVEEKIPQLTEPQGIMGKPNALMGLLRDYADVATVHGIHYIFSRSLPRVDRLLWTFLTIAW